MAPFRVRGLDAYGATALVRTPRGGFVVRSLKPALVWARTLPRLGVINLARVALYRLGVRTGLGRAVRLRASEPHGPYFSGEAPAPDRAAPPGSGHDAEVARNLPPDWFAGSGIWGGKDDPQPEWWKIPDFDPVAGDIKRVWDRSRMDWAVSLAKEARRGDSNAAARLDRWIEDWVRANPPFRGPNWKCGQEASIRVMHLAAASVILRTECAAEAGLLSLVRVHLMRIEPTISYAVAQDNNHGTSEAAALFIGGSWLEAMGDSSGARWAALGRRWMEDRVARLIGADGTFSQYSLNYHRMALDTISFVEVWRRKLGLGPFSPTWYACSAAAASWLHHVVDSGGDGPNVGANDGAFLFRFSQLPYRDYRPSIQLGTALFTGKRAYGRGGAWDEAFHWLGVDAPDEVASPPGHFVADDGGFAVLRKGAAVAMLRYPRFRFRPSHADALHLDLWVDGENLLRDAGTYSYHDAPKWMDYFPGTTAHNTVQFDGRDQMPRLSRFLFGDWLSATGLEPLSDDGGHAGFAAGYKDRLGAHHHRRIRLSSRKLRVTDLLEGFTDQAVLRWRLPPGVDAEINPGADGVEVSVTGVVRMVVRVTSAAPIQAALVEGWESRHYGEKTPVPVLQVELREPGVLLTEIRWGP